MAGPHSSGVADRLQCGHSGGRDGGGVLERHGSRPVDHPRRLKGRQFGEGAGPPAHDVVVVDDVGVHVLDVNADGPDRLGVAITSRIELPLQLARRRVQGELAEVRRDDLSVDAPTARKIVVDACGIELADAEIDALLARTEGWATGLYLAGLSLRSATDPVAAIERFAGDDHNLSEYLTTEVLARLDADDRAFLVGTAVLHQLDGEICDAVLDRDDSSARLAELARTNLFLIPIDQRDGRHRYHHLFREWLLVELRRGGPGVVAETHRRAAHTYIAGNDVMQAAEHAHESGDAELIYRHILQHRLELLDSRHPVGEVDRPRPSLPGDVGSTRSVWPASC